MNQVVDCLCHYYKTDGPEDKHLGHEFVSADARLDPDRELLPIRRYIKYVQLQPDDLVAWPKNSNNLCSRAIR